METSGDTKTEAPLKRFLVVAGIVYGRNEAGEDRIAVHPGAIVSLTDAQAEGPLRHGNVKPIPDAAPALQQGGKAAGQRQGGAQRVQEVQPVDARDAWLRELAEKPLGDFAQGVDGITDEKLLDALDVLVAKKSASDAGGYAAVLRKRRARLLQPYQSDGVTISPPPPGAGAAVAPKP
jgi:hypothetical protein